MYDLNFFATPIRSTKRSYAGVIGIFVIVLVIAGVAGFYILQEMRATTIKTEIQGMQNYLNSNEVTTQLKELDIIKQKTQLLQNYQATFTVIDDFVVQSELVKSELLNQIGITVPAAVTFKALSIADSVVFIDATAIESLPISEFLYNLKETELFSTVELQSVSIDPELAGEQLFSIRAVLKEVILP